MSLWDFLFPPVCPHCGAPVATQGDWCKACFTDLLHIRHVPHKFLHYVDDVCVLAEYRGGLKSMIYDVKFNEKKGAVQRGRSFFSIVQLLHEK